MPEIGPQRRRLAGAVGAEQRDDLAGVDVAGRGRAAPRPPRIRQRAPRARAPAAPSCVLRGRQRSLKRCRRQLGRGRSEIRRDDAGSWRTSSGLPRAMTLPNSSTTTSSEMPSTRPMSWSTSRIGVPCVDDLAQAAAELGRLVDVEAGGGLVHADRAAGSRRGHERPPPACAAPGVSSSGISSATCSRPSKPSASSTACVCRTGREIASRIVSHSDGRWEATVRFSRMERSSNSSIDCHVRASPSRARACAGRSLRSRPSSSTRPRQGTNPVMASMKVVLPAPLGPISPTICASSTCRSTSTSACTSAEPDRHPRGVEHAHGSPAVVVSGCLRRKRAVSRSSSVGIPAFFFSIFFL